MSSVKEVRASVSREDKALSCARWVWVWVVSSGRRSALLGAIGCVAVGMWSGGRWVFR